MIAIAIHKLLYVNSKRRPSPEPGLLEVMIAVDALCSAMMLWYWGQRWFA